MKYINKNSGAAGQLNIIVEANGIRFCRTSFSDNASVKWERWCVVGKDAFWLTLTDPGELENSFWWLFESGAPAEPAAPVAPPAAKTVKVRVAVVVESTGQWNTGGASGGSDEDSVEEAREFVSKNLPSKLYWLTAELPIPQSAEIAAIVQAGQPS